MNNEIALLAQFLESLGPEVSGHSSAPLTDDEIQNIRLFAAGKLGATERAALLPGILGNDRAIHTLVQSIQGQS